MGSLLVGTIRSDQDVCIYVPYHDIRWPGTGMSNQIQATATVTVTQKTENQRKKALTRLNETRQCMTRKETQQTGMTIFYRKPSISQPILARTTRPQIHDPNLNPKLGL